MIIPPSAGAIPGGVRVSVMSGAKPDCRLEATRAKPLLAFPDAT
jgi:hypothetical protein